MYEQFTIRIFERVYYDVTILAESKEAAIASVKDSISGDTTDDLNMIEVDSSGFELETNQ